MFKEEESEEDKAIRIKKEAKEAAKSLRMKKLKKKYKVGWF